MVEVDVAEAASRFAELMDAALNGERVVISRRGHRVALAPVDPPGDVEAHLAALRQRLRGPSPPPTEAELDADIAAMRGRG